jgi:hypothetical protein
MSYSNSNPATKINVGGVAAFGQSLAILNPELSPCGERYAFDQYGRPAAPDSINTTVCPGRFDPSERIEVENSLRSYLSPRYYSLPKGVNQGTDTMFGRGTTKGRNYLNTEETITDVNQYLKDEGSLASAASMNQVAPKSYLHYENHYSRY